MATPATTQQPNDTQIASGAAASQTTDAHASAAAGAQAKFQSEVSGALPGASQNPASPGDANTAHPADGQDRVTDTVREKIATDSTIFNQPKAGEVNDGARKYVDNNAPVSNVHPETVNGLEGHTYSQNGQQYFTDKSGQKYQSDRVGNETKLTAVDDKNQPIVRAGGGASDAPGGDAKGGGDKPQNTPRNVSSDVASDAANRESAAKKTAEAVKVEPGKGAEVNAGKPPESDKPAGEEHFSATTPQPGSANRLGDTGSASGTSSKPPSSASAESVAPQAGGRPPSPGSASPERSSGAGGEGAHENQIQQHTAQLQNDAGIAGPRASATAGKAAGEGTLGANASAAGNGSGRANGESSVASHATAHAGETTNTKADVHETSMQSSARDVGHASDSGGDHSQAGHAGDKTDAGGKSSDVASSTPAKGGAQLASGGAAGGALEGGAQGHGGIAHAPAVDAGAGRNSESGKGRASEGNAQQRTQHEESSGHPSESGNGQEPGKPHETAKGQSPDAGKAHAPDAGKAQAPDAGKTQAPDAGKAHAPDAVTSTADGGGHGGNLSDSHARDKTSGVSNSEGSQGKRQTDNPGAGDHQSGHPGKDSTTATGKPNEPGAKAKPEGGSRDSAENHQAGSSQAKNSDVGKQPADPGALKGAHDGVHGEGHETHEAHEGHEGHESHESHESRSNGSQNNGSPQRNNNGDSAESGRQNKSKPNDQSVSGDPDHQKGSPKISNASGTPAAPSPNPAKPKGPEAGKSPAPPEHEAKAVATAVSDINKAVKAVEALHREHDHEHDQGAGHNADQIGGPKGRPTPTADQSGPQKGRPAPAGDQPAQPAPPRGRQPVAGQDSHGNEPPKGQLLRGGIQNDEGIRQNRGSERQIGAQPGNPLGNIRNDIREVKAIAKMFDGNNEDRNRGNRGDLGRQATNPHDAPGAMPGRDGNDRAARAADIAARIAADGIGRQLGRNAGADGANYKPLVKDAAALVGLLSREFGNNRGQNGQNPGQQLSGGRNRSLGAGNQMGAGRALGTAMRDIGAIAKALEGGSHARDVMSNNAGGLSNANLDAHAVSAYPGAVSASDGDGHGGPGGAGVAGTDSDAHGNGASDNTQSDGSIGDAHGPGDGHGDAGRGEAAARHAHRAEMTALELGQALVTMALASKQRRFSGIPFNSSQASEAGAVVPHGELNLSGKYDDKDKDDDHLPGSHTTNIESAAMLAPGLIKYDNLPKPEHVGKPDAVGKGDPEGLGAAGRKGRPDGFKDSSDDVRGGRDGQHHGHRGGRGLAHDISGMMSGHTAGNRLDLTEGKHDHRKDEDEDEGGKEGFGVRGHKLDAKDELAEKIKKKAEKDAADEIAANARSVMIAAMLNSKNKQNAANKDEKLGLKDTKKKGEDKRTRYVVKEKETLETIAKKQLRDVRLAALIYEINKHMLPLRTEKGKQVADPRPGTPIWLPSDSDIRDFRARMYSGDAAKSPQTASGAKSAEDELSEKFGANWDGSSSPGASAIQANLLGAAVAKSQVRQSNIEKVLGPISTPKAPEAGRIRYIVRLADTVDGVAVKHPALKDVDLWPLLARLNNLPIDVDDLGKPVAQLRRGMVLDVPSPSEIEEFRAEMLSELQIEAASDNGLATGEMDPILRDLGTGLSDKEAVLAPLPESKVNSLPLPVKPINKPAASVTASLPALQTGAMGQGIANTSQPISKLPDIAEHSLPASIFQPYQQGEETRVLPPSLPVEPDDTQIAATSSASIAPPQIVPSQYFNQAAVPPDLVSGGMAYQNSPQTPPQNATAPMPVSQAPLSQPVQQTSQQPPVPTTVDSPLMPQPAIKPVNKPSAADVMRREPIISGDRYMWELERGVRLVKSALRWDPNVGVYRAQLEVLYGGTWYPVIFYEVFPQGSVRHEYMAGGKRKSVNMDLPPIAVQELADNDVVNNWSDYCKRFINHLLGRA